MIDRSIYRNKVEALKKSFIILGVNANEILKTYENNYFDNTSIPKKDSFISLMKLDPSDELIEYLKTKTNLSHFKDKRTNIEYAIDLVLGWLSEDAIIHHLKKRDIKCNLDGRDKYREFLSAKDISTQPDISIEHNKKIIPLEIMNDWNDYWIKRNMIDLRDNKYHKLKQEKSLLLGFAPKSAKGILLDFSDNLDFEERYNPAYGKKSYTLRNIKNKLKDINTCLAEITNSQNGK